MITYAPKLIVCLLLSAASAAASVQDAVERAHMSVERTGSGGPLEEQSRAAALFVEDVRAVSRFDALSFVRPFSAGRRAVAVPSLTGPIFRISSERVPPPFSKRVSAPEGDITRLFLEAHREARAGQAAPLSLGTRRVKYLFVYGLFGKHITDYMQGCVRRLRALGLDADIVGVQTEGDRDANLSRIQSAVSSSEQVVLIGHSRGGVLIHDWYRMASDASKQKVRRLVLVQAPLLGSPITDWALEHWYTRGIVALLDVLPGWGDVEAAFRELTTDTRRQVMAALPPFSSADLDKVYAVYSSFEPGVNDAAHKDMLLAHGIIKDRTGQDSDGLVPVESVQVPGARRVYIRDFDHEDSALEDAGWFKRLIGSRPHDDVRVGDFSEALVRILQIP